MGFFDPYPEFHVAQNPLRLDVRHTVLIEPNLADIAGKTIIDAGGHNGRWSFAALMAGAAKVYCIDGRQDLLDHARAGFEKYEIAPERYEIICGDVLAVMRERQFKVDTVFLFGVFYHIHNHVDWVSEIKKTGCHAVIVDTEIEKSDLPAPFVKFKRERTADVRSTPFELRPGTGEAIVGRPSREFVDFVFRFFGFRVEEIDWAPAIARWPTADLADYGEGRRAVFVARRRKVRV